MKARLLFITLLMSQFLFSQFGDELLEKKVKQLNSRNLKASQVIKEFGSCDADCFSPNIFNPHLNDSTFKVSHGSPSFSAGNSIWMWSYTSGLNIIGEGVFTNFNFQKGRIYCIEADIELSRSGTTEPINPNATFNIDATNSVTSNPVGGGGGLLPNITQKQSIISGNYSSGVYPLNTTFKIRKTYTPNTNYSQLWIYPRNPGKPHPQLNMRISNLVIKEVVSCPCQIKGTIKIKQRENCEYQFYANTKSNSNTSIKGYLWEFGDGSTSIEKNPIHTYSSNGNYTATLTVYGVGKDGECCTELFTTKIKVSEKCKVKCEITAKFNVKRRGFWFWRCYDFINTSTTNAFTTIIGYEWYVDGSLVSTQKDFKNYRGRGKNMCLIVYGIDANGDCCSNKYCSKVRQNIILNNETRKL